MNRRTARVVVGFLELTDDERREALDEIRNDMDILRKRTKSIRELEIDVQGKVLLGPVATVCPCCGR